MFNVQTVVGAPVIGHSPVAVPPMLILADRVDRTIVTSNLNVEEQVSLAPGLGPLLRSS